jgi:hypothetical protein
MSKVPPQSILQGAEACVAWASRSLLRLFIVKNRLADENPELHGYPDRQMRFG